jgi:pimeloyl-ACP methyl ester carboxylesterase
MSLTRVLRRPMIGLTAVVVAAAGVATLTLARNANATTSPSKAPQKSVVSQLESYRSTHHAVPTIVLVHGAWADASSWSGEAAIFQRAGYTVRAIANPLQDLTTDAETVADFLKTVEGPIVLVGHSYGGSVITNAAAGNPNVKALVYVDAAAPAPGETNGSLSGATSALNADPSTLFDTVTYPGAPAGAQDLYLKKNIFENNFGNDLPTVVTDRLWAQQRTASTAAFQTPSKFAAWQTIPSWYFISTGDQIITAQSELAMAHRAHSHITLFHGGSHLTLISHPTAVAKTIAAAVFASH